MQKIASVISAIHLAFVIPGIEGFFFWSIVAFACGLIIVKRTAAVEAMAVNSAPDNADLIQEERSVKKVPPKAIRIARAVSIPVCTTKNLSTRIV
jgi:hypothetical protein